MSADKTSYRYFCVVYSTLFIHDSKFFCIINSVFTSLLGRVWSNKTPISFLSGFYHWCRQIMHLSADRECIGQISVYRLYRLIGISRYRYRQIQNKTSICCTLKLGNFAIMRYTPIWWYHPFLNHLKVCTTNVTWKLKASATNIRGAIVKVL